MAEKKTGFSIKKIIGFSVLIILIGVIIVFAFLREKNTYELLKKQWKYKSITDVNGKPIQKVGIDDKLILSKEFTFKHTSLSDSLVKTGVWRFEKNILILTVNFSVTLDSFEYCIENNKPTIFNYSKGKLIGINSGGDLSIKQKIVKYEVEKCTEQYLTLWKSIQPNREDLLFLRLQSLFLPFFYYF